MKKERPTPQQIKYALDSISKMGSGMKPEMIDWKQVGKNAVHLAKETLRPKCIECGK